MKDNHEDIIARYREKYTDLAEKALPGSAEQFRRDTGTLAPGNFGERRAYAAVCGGRSRDLRNFSALARIASS